jgi:hypothetical protein
VALGHHPKTAELIIGTASKPRITLSGTMAAGMSPRTVVLSAGKWFFEPSMHGPKTAFTVVR